MSTNDFVYFGILFFFAALILLSMWNDHRKDKLEKLKAEQNLTIEKQASHIVQSVIDESNNIGTRDLFLDTLTKMGCQYQLGEGEDNRIFFAYQGENFFADTSNNIFYVHLWDTHWGYVELYDIDEVSRLRKAINISNLNTSITTVYTVDDAGNNMDVHSKTSIAFISSMPHLEDYLKAILNDFFRAHQMVGIEMQKLREEECCS